MRKPYNRSKTYLFPLLTLFISFEEEHFNLLKNTYLFDSEGKYKNCIFLEHDISFKLPEHTKYEHRLVDNPHFVDLIDCSDNKVIYIFKFPQDYMREYNLYLDSKFSLFSEDAKDVILNFWKKIYGKTVPGVKFIMKVKQILYKEESLRKELEKKLSVVLDRNAELCEFVDVKNETIDLNEYKNKVSKRSFNP